MYTDAMSRATLPPCPLCRDSRTIRGLNGRLGNCTCLRYFNIWKQTPAVLRLDDTDFPHDLLATAWPLDVNRHEAGDYHRFRRQAWASLAVPPVWPEVEILDLARVADIQFNHDAEYRALGALTQSLLLVVDLGLAKFHRETTHDLLRSLVVARAIHHKVTWLFTGVEAYREAKRMGATYAISTFLGETTARVEDSMSSLLAVGANAPNLLPAGEVSTDPPRRKQVW